MNINSEDTQLELRMVAIGTGVGTVSICILNDDDDFRAGDILCDKETGSKQFRVVLTDPFIVRNANDAYTELRGLSERYRDWLDTLVTRAKFLKEKSEQPDYQGNILEEVKDLYEEFSLRLRDQERN